MVAQKQPQVKVDYEYGVISIIISREFRETRESLAERARDSGLVDGVTSRNLALFSGFFSFFKSRGKFFKKKGIREGGKEQFKFEIEDRKKKPGDIFQKRRGSRFNRLCVDPYQIYVVRITIAME